MLAKLEPFMIGGILAFLFNIPLSFIEEKCLGFIKKKRCKRVLALISSITLLFCVFAGILVLIMPKMAGIFNVLINQLPKMKDRCLLLLGNKEMPVGNLLIENWMNGNVPTVISKLSTVLTKLTRLVGDVFAHFTDIGMGSVIAIYFLLYKEDIKSVLGKGVDFCLSDENATFVKFFFAKWYENSKHFLLGQCTEAVIFGSMICVALHIFQIPFANLIGILMTLCAIIPIVGPFVGSMIGAILICTISFWKMLLFILLYLILQQIEDNLIYPRIVGNAVGLPAFLTFFSIILGHKIGGIIGILVVIPLLSTVYYLFQNENCFNFLKKIKNNT